MSGNDTFMSLPMVTASQLSSVSSLILTCSGKLWPIIAAAAGALELYTNT